jgi:hypothetical protein
MIDFEDIEIPAGSSMSGFLQLIKMGTLLKQKLI